MKRSDVNCENFTRFFCPTLYLNSEQVFDEHSQSYHNVLSYRPMDFTPQHFVDDITSLLASGVEPVEAPRYSLDTFQSVNQSIDSIMSNSLNS